MRILRLAAAATALLAAPCARAQDVAATPALQENVAYAQERFLRGVELYHARQFDAALLELRASLALYASPNPRLYIARCLREQGDPVAAAAEYERTAREARERARVDPRYVPTAETAAAEYARLDVGLARLTVRVRPSLPPGARVSVAGRRVPAEALGLPVRVLAGPVEVRVEMAGAAPIVRRVELAARSTQTVELTLAPPSTTAAPLPAPVQQREEDHGTARTVAWSSLAVGGVGLVSFGVFFALAQQQYDRLENSCVKPCPASETRLGQGFEWTSNLSAVVAGVGAVVGLGAYLLAARRSQGPTVVRHGFAPGLHGLEVSF